MEKAYEILANCVPRLVSKLDNRDAPARNADSRVEKGKLTEYEVYIRILKRLNTYAICEDRASERATEYDLTDEGDLCLIVQFRSYLSAYVKDKSNKKVRYLLFSLSEDAGDRLKESVALKYFIPLGDLLSSVVPVCLTLLSHTLISPHRSSSARRSSGIPHAGLFFHRN